MGSENILKEYSDSIKSLRRECLDGGLEEEAFREFYFESLKSLDSYQQLRNENRPMLTTKLKYLVIGMLVLGICIYNFTAVYACIVCNLQDYIYPGLRLLRKLSIPFISLFPSLSEYYHETCLIQNPFFTVADMDCWPCSTASNVREIYNPSESVNMQQNTPFIYATDQQIIDMTFLKDIYFKNKHVFDKEATKILVDNSKHYTTSNEMFTQGQLGEALYIWKINSMPLARLLRQYIPRPKIVPKFGQSTERFILIDSSRNKFKVPDTECTFSFLLSLSGNRNIDLEPAEECKHQCKSLKVELRESYLLWYNWWYWRPVVQSTSSNVTFIAHLGSYC
ncbi:unnamed protein product [Chilo suppressalis]|uniref:Uncharacterized protein n=1 Tax=Chilo suppressalis TaxID=168631 RepID=A0ABN8AWP5_CHISP|nr:unnamed protein product [Chilo suppressalis]